MVTLEGDPNAELPPEPVVADLTKVKFHHRRRNVSDLGGGEAALIKYLQNNISIRHGT